ncbi:MAG: AtpZ/AtpI family protein [Candidatus Saccharimonadales bacterium]
MSDAANTSDKTPPPDKSTVILLFLIAADTTWRMFVPVIGGTIMGVWADNTVTDKPLGTIIGVTIGVIVATVLIRDQLRKTNK